ncbi:MAG: GFA family protein, partial [Stellaceae bacterium]
LCGAVRFVATGQPKGVYWCHCDSCRRHSGAPAAVFVAFERTAYTVTQGEITKFDSTPGRTRRGFCRRCGSTLTCESASLPTETHFHIGAFDRAAELKPTRHVFREEHLPWFPLAD